MFAGTNDYCTKYPSDKSNYKVGSQCSTKKKTGTKYSGLDPRSFDAVIQGQKLCVKRDNTLNYHSLADNRDDFGKVCGSTSNKEL